MKMRPGFMAPVAGLFMILAVLAFSVRIPHGYYAKLAVKAKDCGDGHRLTVLHVSQDGQVSINHEIVPAEEIESRLRTIFSMRAERLLFLSADPKVPFAEIAKVVDVVNAQVDHVALLTPAAEEAPGTCLTINMPPAMDFGAPPQPPAHMKEVPVWRIWRK